MSKKIHVGRLMRKREVLGWAMGVICLLLLLRLVVYGSINGWTGPVDRELGTTLPDSSVSFTIDGSTAEPISPGVMAPLDLTFTNPHAAPMSVINLRVSVQKVSAPKADDAHPCAASVFAVNQAHGITINVAPQATNTLSSLGLARATWPQVGLLNTSVNQDGCKGASLRLAYTASGKLE